MEIVDAQVHVWQASTPEHPWPAGSNKPHKPVPVTKEDILREMDAAGVARAVLVTPSWQGDYNGVTLEAARAHPDRFGVMGRLDITVPDARSQIARWLKQPGMLGLRFTFKIQGNENDDWVWPAVEAANIPIMQSTDQLSLLGRAAARHPGLRIVIDPPLAKGDNASSSFPYFDDLLALGKLPNIALKVKALPNRASDDYPYPSMHSYLRRMYDAFGPKRLFWGTDLTGLRGSYRESITMLTEEVPWLTAEDKEWIMGRGLCEWIGWKVA